MEGNMVQYVKVLLPTEELEAIVLPYIGTLREEGFSERHILEWAISAWIEVERPPSPFRPIGLTPREAIGEILHDVFVRECLLTHLSPQEAARVLKDAYDVCVLGYNHFSQYLDNYRGLECTGDVTVTDWLTDTIILEVAIA